MVDAVRDRPMQAAARLATVLRGVRRLPKIPVLVLSIVVVAGVFANWIAPHDPRDQNLRERLLPPVWGDARVIPKEVVDEVPIGERHIKISLQDAREINEDVEVGKTIEVVTRAAGSTKYLLGTDQLGRDILSRIIHGARISLIVAAVTLGVGGGVGVLLGLLSGWYGGWVDEVIMRLVDIILSMPIILVALVWVAARGSSFQSVVAVLAIWIWPRFARMVRGEVLQIKTKDYVSLARVSGASTVRILFVHLFPGTINTLIVVATLQVGIVILVEATLSFLGVGVPPPNPAWGSMVADGRSKLVDAWWVATMPGLAILATVMSLNLFGDWLRDTLDPRLRQME